MDTVMHIAVIMYQILVGMRGVHLTLRESISVLSFTLHFLKTAVHLRERVRYTINCQTFECCMANETESFGEGIVLYPGFSFGNRTVEDPIPTQAVLKTLY